MNLDRLKSVFLLVPGAVQSVLEVSEEALPGAGAAGIDERNTITTGVLVVDFFEKTASAYIDVIKAAGGDVPASVEMGPDSFFEAARELAPKLPQVDAKSKVAEAILMEVARKIESD